MTPVPLAYKYVAVAVMLAEINYCASRLQLPMNLPISESDIRVEKIYNPYVLSRVGHRPVEYGFAGSFDTSNYRFTFTKSGRLRYIMRLDNGFQAYSTTKVQGDLPTRDFLPQLVGIHSVINTNEAYQLATNWLMAIDVDVNRLQMEQPVKVEQDHLKDDPLPIFDVYWGKGVISTIRVWIAADTKDLLRLRQEDDSYSKRPFTLIKNMDKLLEIPDEEFMGYSPMQRSNLVAQFSAVNYFHTNAPQDNFLGEKK